MRFILISLLTLIPILGFSAEIPPPPELAVKAYVLKDFNSNAEIASYQKDERVEPASLTKVMTAYLVFSALKAGHLKLDQTLPVSEFAWKGGGGGCGGDKGSCMFIDPKSIVTVDELLQGMIIVSGNDASVALAEGIAGTEAGFADLMNKKAAQLGMKNTHYMNATGLPNVQHYTTANDLAILATALIRDFPQEYKRYYSQKEFTYKNIPQQNRNTLLFKDPTVDGMKTGHTATAGYCLIASSKHDNTRLISVILGTTSDTMRATESQKLLNYGFQFFESTLVYKQGQIISKQPVYKGSEKIVTATFANDFYLNLPKGEYGRVKASMSVNQPLIAPLKSGQTIGKITFSLDGKLVGEQSLVAGKAIEEAGIFGRIVDSIRLLMHSK